MPNNYFQFKQFTIYQHQCAMKVTTDGCLFGAWVAEQVAANKQTYPGNNTLLDIGTGTGLLSLMLAQKTDCMIDAIEMEENAFQQALSNAAQSPWNSRIKITQADARTFSAEKKYDCIISNPPFLKTNWLRLMLVKTKHFMHMNFQWKNCSLVSKEIFTRREPFSC